MPTANTLRPNQARAVNARGTNLVVVAGAGTGKTRVLVDRFLSLLDDGADLPSLVAITFTEKAAGEMRTRVRQAITDRAENADAADRPKWERALRAMDAARIGTIHSFCAALLRANPVEAQLDPRFEVLDETDADIWQEQALDAALTEISENGGDELALFREYKIYDIRSTGLKLLKLGMLADDAFAKIPATRDELVQFWRSTIETNQRDGLQRFAEDQRWLQAASWAQLNLGRSDKDGLEKIRVEDESLLNEFDPTDFNKGWGTIRAFAEKRKVGNNGSDKNWDDLKNARLMLNTLRDVTREYVSAYVLELTDVDNRAADMILLWRAFWNRLRGLYQRHKNDARALDFNDLETQAHALLKNNAIVRERYRSEISSILIDEFQDTNAAQRDIMYHLADLNIADRLFVVGDGKQSIYGFRGADVSVFTETLNEITQQWGAASNIALDESFRTHQDLVTCFNSLFTCIFHVEGKRRGFEVQYDNMRGLRASPARPALMDIVQIPRTILVNDDERRLSTDEIRTWEANELAQRLSDLVAQRFPVWDQRKYEYRPVRFDDFAMLFRVASSLPIYEQALQDANIPFLTYAGTGYYDRAEVRDLIQLLRALDNPADDLALATVLHSPLYALSSETLYHLRRTRQPFRHMLSALPDTLTGDERARAEFANTSLQGLWQQVGRVTILDLLQRALDETGYLATVASLSNGKQRRANVEKLLALARRTGLVRLSEFNAYLSDLTARQVREGDASVETGNAVQLMTIHRAKGLEFPIVVLPDAGRAPYDPSELLVADRTDGIGLQVHDEHGERLKTVGFQLIKRQAAQRDLQEEKRLLYVAMTRAQEYLIVSGGEPRSDSPLKQLLDAHASLEPDIAARIALHAPQTNFAEIESRITSSNGATTSDSTTTNTIAAALPPLVAPLPAPTIATLETWTPTGLQALVEKRALFEQRMLEGAPERILPVGRSTKSEDAPAYVVGEMAHRALRAWRFPGSTPQLDTILERYAVERGLSDELEIRNAVQRARALLARFQRSELFAEMSNAPLRQHEVPFVVPWQGRMLHGTLDALYQTVDGIWHVVDFKTDRIAKTETAHAFTLDHYAVQMALYQDAVRALFNTPCDVSIYYIRTQERIRPGETELAAALDQALALISKPL